jgi:hypothetical protein
MELAVVSLQANNRKIPYTDAGADMMLSVVTGSLGRGELAGGLAPNEWSASVPKVSATTATQRGNRELPDVKFSARLAGAINKTRIIGTVTV